MFTQLSDIRWPQGMNSERFLRDYWQQKPLFIPQALPNFHSPISAEALAGLACDTDISSRIVAEKGFEKPWSVHYGTFESEDFTTLAKSHWTLLVNDVEKYILESYHLLEKFKFIPNWRIDDLMISYAVPEGSVGPHYDEYDVFLLQADGQRRWQIDTPIQQQQAPALLPDLEVKILKHFNAAQEWITNPGDLLYLPPYVPHYGVSIESSLCYSIGFRAPSAQELLADFADHCYQQEFGNQRFQDKKRALQTHHTEITTTDIGQLKQLLQQTFLETSETAFNNWLGCYLTQARGDSYSSIDEQLDSLSETNTHDTHNAVQLETQSRYKRHPNSRFAFIEHNDQSLSLFVDGDVWSLPIKAKAFLLMLCEDEYIELKRLKPYVSSEKINKIIKKLIKEKKLTNINNK